MKHALTIEGDEITQVEVAYTWADLLPGMLAVIANPEASFNGRTMIEGELMRMARAADLYVQYRKAGGE
jgi:hypothetical protein